MKSEVTSNVLGPWFSRPFVGMPNIQFCRSSDEESSAKKVNHQRGRNSSYSSYGSWVSCRRRENLDTKRWDGTMLTLVQWSRIKRRSLNADSTSRDRANRFFPKKTNPFLFSSKGHTPKGLSSSSYLFWSIYWTAVFLCFDKQMNKQETAIPSSIQPGH